MLSPFLFLYSFLCHTVQEHFFFFLIIQQNQVCRSLTRTDIHKLFKDSWYRDCISVTSVLLFKSLCTSVWLCFWSWREWEFVEVTSYFTPFARKEGPSPVSGNQFFLPASFPLFWAVFKKTSHTEWRPIMKWIW